MARGQATILYMTLSSERFRRLILSNGNPVQIENCTSVCVCVCVCVRLRATILFAKDKVRKGHDARALSHANGAMEHTRMEV